MKCSKCGEKISKCEGCSEPFKLGDEIICQESDFNLHYCSGDCLREDTHRAKVEGEANEE